MTRTCGQCMHLKASALATGNIPCQANGGQSVAPGSAACSSFNAPTGLQWVPEFDVLDPSDDLSDCVITSWQLVRANSGMQSRPGFVSLYPPTGKWLAMYSQPCFRWYRQVGHGPIRGCACALIARVKGETS
jgi:hypothetical protein